MRALIVDDLATMRHFLAMCLADFPELDFDQAADGAEAIRALQQRAYDLVLLDLTLPVVDGLKVLGHVRETPLGGPQLPVVVMTTRTDEATQQKVEELGGLFVPKPVRAVELREVIRKVLQLPERERPRSDRIPGTVEWTFNGVTHRHPAMDLNALGAFLPTETPAPVGSKGEVTLRFGRDEPIQVGAKVVHVRPQPLDDDLPAGFAVQFEPQTPEVSRRLARAFTEPLNEDAAELRLAAKLRRMPAFRELLDDEVALLKDIIQEVSYAAGESILAEGDASDAFYIVKSGAVEITKGNPPQELAVLREGDFFGEMGVLLRAPRSASVLAVAPTELYRIMGDDFFGLLRNHPEMMERIRSTMITRYAANVDAIFADAVIQGV